MLSRLTKELTNQNLTLSEMKADVELCRKNRYYRKV